MELGPGFDLLHALHNFHNAFTATAKEHWTIEWKTQSSARFIRLIARSVC